MRATDLRIGNYIGCDGDILIVEKIDSKNNIGFSLFKKAVGQHVNSGNKYYIELTEEILLKCGFEKATIPTAIKDIFIVYYKKDSFVVYLMNDFFEIELITKDGEQFNLFRTFKKELHILQNIYQLLENQELTINL